MWWEEQISSYNSDVAQIIIGIWDRQVGRLEGHLSYFDLGHETVAAAQTPIHGLLRTLFCLYIKKLYLETYTL